MGNVYVCVYFSCAFPLLYFILVFIWLFYCFQEREKEGMDYSGWKENKDLGVIGKEKLLSEYNE